MTDANTLGKVHKRIRDAIAAKKAEQKAELKELTDQLEMVEDALTQALKDTGAEDPKLTTDGGSFFFKVQRKVSVDDLDAFFAFVQSTGDPYFFTKAARKEAVLKFLDEHSAAPPGVEVTSMQVLGYRS